MKKQTHSNFKTMLRGLVFILLFIGGFSYLHAQTSMENTEAEVSQVRYYESSEAETMAGDMVNALDGDVFILTTSGGVYEYVDQADITKSITIMADEDLEERPIMRTIRENNTKQVLRIRGDGGASITVKGIEFNSGSLPAGSWPAKYAIRTLDNIGRYTLVVEGCYFTGIWQANDGSPGSAIKLYNGTHADSIIFRNCVFEGDMAFVANSSGEEFGWEKLEISNCSFINIPDEQALLISQRGENIYDPVRIDHCSFYGVGGIDKEAIVTDSLFDVKLTNSIFGTTPANTLWHMWGDATAQNMADYLNFFESPQPLTDKGGVLGTNIWTEDPQFADPENGDLTLGNQALYTLGSDGLPLGDLRWADIFGPKVVEEMTARSDSTLLLKFDEWVDTTSAVVPANYQLSGSAGYTGNVKDVELFNFRSVLITLESFLGLAESEIVITLSGVEDLEGNVVDPEHNVASYLVREFRPVVTNEAQNVTNGADEVVFVQSNRGEGTVYIILDGEPQSTLAELDAAVSANKGAMSPVTTAFTETEIEVSGIETGTYYAYATDAKGNISQKGENQIVVTDGIPPVVTASLQSTGNNALGSVVAQSNEPGTIYIILDGEPQEDEIDLISATYADKGEKTSVTAPDTDVDIPTEGLVPGIYFAYAIDEAGNMSEKGTSPFNIVEATGIEPGVEGYFRVYSVEKTVVVECTQEDGNTIVVTDLLGRRIINTKLTNSRSEFMLDHDGIYIVNIVNEKGMTQTTKLFVQ